MRNARVGGGILAAAALVALVAAVTLRSRKEGSIGFAPLPSAAMGHACGDGLSPLAFDACYAAPAGRTGTVPLIIFLHGYFEEGPGEGQNEALDQQRRVAMRATSRGYAVLALRGELGACAVTPENANKVCWPSNEKVAYKGPRFVESWQAALDAAAARHPFDRKYIFGFSNGGYFAGLIAVRALYGADAFAIAHAGPVEPVRALGRKPPILLLSADDDASQDGMVLLDDELTREGWLHEHFVRGGGHALPDSDIDAALTFFTRTRTESLPLRPPISTRIPRARQAPTDPAHGVADTDVLDAEEPLPLAGGGDSF